jgi:TetR/AcrR family transcriptional repressor of nem operon
VSKKQELLALAQIKVRTGGYSNFSFRELAAEAGIKSASVHYHFPTKADLGAELARQYTDSFLSILGEPDELVAKGINPISAYIDMFRNALKKDKKMCLCGLLGAESEALPLKVKEETRRFFERNIAWIEKAYLSLINVNESDAKSYAIRLVSLLEGAMLISKTLDSDDFFDIAIKDNDTFLNPRKREDLV